MRYLRTPPIPNPGHIMIVCPYCFEENQYCLLMLGSIDDRKVVCRGCARSFRFSVRWHPKISTEKMRDYD